MRGCAAPIRSIHELRPVPRPASLTPPAIHNYTRPRTVQTPAAACTAIRHGGAGLRLPPAIVDWLSQRAFRVDSAATADELLAAAIRRRPRLVLLDGRSGATDAESAARRLKLDSYTGVVPVVVIVAGDAPGALAGAFAAGADEVISDAMHADEVNARLDAFLERSDRDTGVHPSTRLRGAPAIATEYARRVDSGLGFGVSYVDLDHFKEFNDRYGYEAGDRVIRIVAEILRDVVKGRCGEDGFVGHIGGDDFICVTPDGEAARVCEEIVDVFDTLIPFQYSTADRDTRYYFGKDRRGQLHRVPLMTVSIGIVTNTHRELATPSQISELATEMKSYAKTLPGSVYVIDRRHEDAPAATGRPAGGVPGRG